MVNVNGDDMNVEKGSAGHGVDDGQFDPWMVV